MLGTFSTDGTFVPLNGEKAIEFKQRNMEAFTGMGLGPDGKPLPPALPGSGDEGDGKGSGEAAPEGSGGGGADSGQQPPPSSAKKPKPNAEKGAEGEVAMASRPFRHAVRGRVHSYP